MENVTPEEKEAWMRRRIQQLRNQLDEISGGDATFGPLGDEGMEGAPLEVIIKFLENVVEIETAEDTTWRRKLQEAGYEMPPPDSLTDEALSRELGEVIQQMAKLRAFLERTDHLSDRELYEKLYVQIDEPEANVPISDATAIHFDMISIGDEEDTQSWLRYFADEFTREQWQSDYGGELPPKEDPPYDRDKHLPKPARPGLQS